MKLFDISRTRLVTDRFRVIADSEEHAYDAIGCESDDAEKIEESTHQSSSVTNSVEELD